MKTRREIEAMLKRIESLSQDRPQMVMVMEWILNKDVSTSLPLEEWLKERETD